MYADFKRTLTFAEIVIRRNTVLPDKSKDAKNKASGYLLDIASLWEVYLEHVLREGLNEWDVSAQEVLNLYNGCFFERPNYPDLVLRKKDDPSSKVVVLDAKFKKMQFRNTDVDRGDLHQIHSYAGYYRENGDMVVLCGLIYPLSLENPVKNKEKLYGLDKPKTLFVIDGIYKGKKSKQENSQKTDDNAGESTEDENSEIPEELDKGYSYVEAEEAFIKRMQNYLNKAVKNLEENQ
jgi:5-methylcytosine-specific restriction endonuclease McrBC regulatory subunit McrC